MTDDEGIISGTHQMDMRDAVEYWATHLPRPTDRVWNWLYIGQPQQFDVASGTMLRHHMKRHNILPGMRFTIDGIRYEVLGYEQETDEYAVAGLYYTKDRGQQAPKKVDNSPQLGGQVDDNSPQLGGALRKARYGEE